MISMPHLAAVGWNHRDEMVSADKGGGGIVYFTYDAGGERVRKVYEHNGLIEERIYLGGWEIYRKRLVSAPEEIVLERETLHMMDGVRRIAMVETKTIDEAAGGAFQVTTVTRFQLGNHLGSAALEVDAGGMVISYEEYHPYGTTAYWSASGAVEVSKKRYRYTGKEKDEETGLYYHGARYYASWLGRWTAADPVGVRDGVNLFVYVHGNPLILVDPNGAEGVPSKYHVHIIDPGAKTGVVGALLKALDLGRVPEPTPPQAPAKRPAFYDWRIHPDVQIAGGAIHGLMIRRYPGLALLPLPQGSPEYEVSKALASFGTGLPKVPTSRGRYSTASVGKGTSALQAAVAVPLELHIATAVLAGAKAVRSLADTMADTVYSSVQNPTFSNAAPNHPHASASAGQATPQGGGAQQPTTSPPRPGSSRGVEIVDNRGASLGEFDEIEAGRFIEDKTATRIGTPNPRTGLVSNTPASWARKQIFEKTKTRIDNLLTTATATRATPGGSSAVPTFAEIRSIRAIHFRISSTDQAVQTAVNTELANLRTTFPNWTFSATFGQ